MKDMLLQMLSLKKLAFVLVAFLSSVSNVKAESPTHALLQKFCYDCHDSDIQKGKFQIDILNRDISSGVDAERWQLVLDQLNLDEMPPKKKKQPTPDERLQLINYITQSLKNAAELKRKDAQVVMRRLTKQQYTNSLRDLLALDIDFGKPLPSERLSEDGFKNNGEEQVISLLQTEYYQSIAESALDKAILEEAPVSYKYLFTFGSGINKKKSDKAGRKTSGTEKHINEKDYVTATFQNDDIANKDSKYVSNELYKFSFADMRGSKKSHYKIVEEGIRLNSSLPQVELYEKQDAFLSPTPNIQLQLKQFPSEGNFLLRVKVAKVDPKSPNAYVRAFLGERLDWGTDSRMFEHPVKVTGTMKNFQTIEFRGRLENFPTPIFDPCHKDPNTTLIVGIINDSGKLKNKPAIIVSEIELITEPLESWPPKSHGSIFFPSKNQADEKVYSREIIKRFMTKAFRRPVSSQELDEYHGLWKSIRPHCNTFEESIKDSLSAVLTSPRFLYLMENIRAEDSTGVSEIELASRLSYFLWNSMPDYELLKLAHNNKLMANLDSQLERMLSDSRSQGFVDAFTSEWLQIERMLNVKINTNRFRRFNKYIREDMVRETRHFFAEVLKSNLSIMNFIDSDFTMLNENLADYYEIDNVKGNYFRRVSVKNKPERRGLISHGLFMSGNSDGSEGNPIKRGVWMISRIMDTPPPEPPPNVPEIDSGDPGFAKLTIREQLEKHRQNKSCFECHRKIDPWGLLFENYNAAGMWSEKKLDDVTLSNGKKLNNVMDLKAYILKDKKEQFARAMTKYLLRYSLGRSLSYVDETAIDEIVAASKKDDYKLKSLILAIIKNPLFSKK